MEITIDYLMSGLSTVIKGKQYLSTMRYVNSFVTSMRSLNATFRSFVQSPRQSAVMNGMTLSLFNRVWVQACLPDQGSGYRETINLVYALDNATPAYKFFKGWQDGEDHLVVPGIDYIVVGNIEPESDIPDDFKNILDMDFDVESWLMKMDAPIKNRTAFFGKVIDNVLSYSVEWTNGMKTKISADNITTAYSRLFKKDGSIEKYVTFLDFFNGVADTFHSCRDFFCLAEKSFMASAIIQDNISS